MLFFFLLMCNTPFVIKFSVEAQIDIIISNKIRPAKKFLQRKEANTFITVRSLLNGSLEELRKMSKTFIMESIKEFEKIQTRIDKKFVIWDIIKDNKFPQMLNYSEIKQIGNLIQFIPERDLFNLNVSDWKIVNHLGTSLLHRRQTGIIGYAIKQLWGDRIMKDLNILNQMKGLICGFSLQDLQSIPNRIFFQLNHTVFKYMTSCTEKQLQLLIGKVKKIRVHGPPQSWNAKTCEDLSILIKSLSITDLKTIRPVAMKGINFQIIEEMNLEKLFAFSEEQVHFMNTKALSSYRRITGIIYSNSKNLGCHTLFTLIVYKFSLQILK